MCLYDSRFHSSTSPGLFWVPTPPLLYVFAPRASGPRSFSGKDILASCKWRPHRDSTEAIIQGLMWINCLVVLTGSELWPKPFSLAALLLGSAEAMLGRWQSRGSLFYLGWQLIGSFRESSITRASPCETQDHRTFHPTGVLLRLWILTEGGDLQVSNGEGVQISKVLLPTHRDLSPSSLHPGWCNASSFLSSHPTRSFTFQNPTVGCILC